MPNAIRVEQLSKTFISRAGHKKVAALDNIKLDVREGEIFGILGPNGAGKTTFVNVLSTLLLPDNGSIEIFGQKLTQKNSYAYRHMINMASGHPNFQNIFTPYSMLKFYGRLYGLRGAALEKQALYGLDIFGLERVRDLNMDELSSGLKQRAALARCFINGPKIAFLDEPTSGLDPEVAVEMRNIILNMSKSKRTTIIFTTHNMPEAELLCDRIAFLRGGKLIRLSTAQELMASLEKKDLEEVFLSLARQHSDAPPVVESVPEDSQFAITPASPIDLSTGPWQEETFLWLNRCYAFIERSILHLKSLGPMLMVILLVMLNLLSFVYLSRFVGFQEQFFNFIAIGLVAWGFLCAVQENVFFNIIDEVWSKSLKHTYLSPTGVSESLVGMCSVGVLRGLVAFVLQLAVLKIFFHFSPPNFGSGLVLVLGLSAVMLAWSVWMSLLILLFGKKVEPALHGLFLFFVTWSGTYSRIDVFPGVLNILAQLIPLTYFLEFIRQDYGFTPTLTLGLWKGFGLCGFYFIVGFGLIKCVIWRARKNGDIVRMSE